VACRATVSLAVRPPGSGTVVVYALSINGQFVILGK
jgi:hypothetical protein